MKKLKYILLYSWIATGYAFTGYAQEQQDLNDLGNSIISSLQNNDPDAFLQAHINKKDYEELTSKSSKIASKKEKTSDADSESFDTLEEAYKNNFEEIIQKGISRQINWKEVNFFRIENADKTTNEGNLPVIHNPIIVFTYKEEELKLQADKIAKLNRGWVVVGNIAMQ
ncbi:hypothetical protein GXP67_01990 [Rhodocytophaga rosea]|uniref:Uncharacterized protein n=1 Tax=Rhodocytophaga rosea TaxID=2704465 RepID=A0A6C0GCI0_9BACT|nr:hypothetical protein [Rhodocytophaga rosea]QHT65523.1 hypothetical protein GXP67_01990 [Rhodocytophaga rosea]